MFRRLRIFPWGPATHKSPLCSNSSRLQSFRSQILPSCKYRKVLRRGRITLPKTFYLYNPILNTTAIRILIQPVTNLEIVTAAIPTWVVSGFASVIPRPTGIKSQAH